MTEIISPILFTKTPPLFIKTPTLFSKINHYKKNILWFQSLFKMFNVFSPFVFVRILCFCFIIFLMIYLLAHLTPWPKGSDELLSPLSVRRLSSDRPLTFHILINCSEATGTIWTKLWWNGPWMAPFQKCVRWSRLSTKMAAKLKIEKRGDEILIVHCCFSTSQNELKF